MKIIDICGTGGSGHNTLNISTAAAFLIASTGQPMAFKIYNEIKK